MKARVVSRKALHSYAVPIFATIVFIILFIGLWSAHQYALGSIGNLAKVNPLIASSGKTALLSEDRTTDPTVGQFDETKSTTEPATSQATGDAPVSDTPKKQSSSSGGLIQQPTQNQSGGGTTPTSPPPTPTSPQFSVGLGAIDYNKTQSGILTGLLGCTIEHQFKVTVSGQNGPGTVKYRWVRSVGGNGGMEQKTFSTGSSSIDLTYSWKTTNSGDYWVSLEVSAPSNMEKKMSFQHKCS